MKFNFRYKLGLRAIKTAIAVALCMVMSYLTDKDETFIAAFAAIICMQPTYDQTFKSGLNRIFGTLIGGIVGYVFLELFKYIPMYRSWWNIILGPMCLLLVIYICNMINKKPSVSIACIVLLCCIAQPSQGVNNTLTYVIQRVLVTIYGILITIGINRFLWPKKSKLEYQNSIKKLENQENNLKNDSEKIDNTRPYTKNKTEMIDSTNIEFEKIEIKK